MSRLPVCLSVRQNARPSLLLVPLLSLRSDFLLVSPPPSCLLPVRSFRSSQTVGSVSTVCRSLRVPNKDSFGCWSGRRGTPARPSADLTVVKCVPCGVLINVSSPALDPDHTHENVGGCWAAEIGLGVTDRSGLSPGGVVLRPDLSHLWMFPTVACSFLGALLAVSALLFCLSCLGMLLLCFRG